MGKTAIILEHTQLAREYSDLSRNAESQEAYEPIVKRKAEMALLLESDVDIRYIQKIVGHSSITTMETYYAGASLQKQEGTLGNKHPRDGMLVVKGN